MNVVPADVVKRSPRAVAAVAFGAATAAVVHFAWVQGARMSGTVPWWTAVAAVNHAIAGASIGPRLVDGRTRDMVDASLLGTGASAVAVSMTAVLLSIWVTLTSASAVTAGSLLAAIPMVIFFAFVAIGWALLLCSAAIASLMYLASRH